MGLIIKCCLFVNKDCVSCFYLYLSSRLCKKGDGQRSLCDDRIPPKQIAERKR